VAEIEQLGYIESWRWGGAIAQRVYPIVCLVDTLDLLLVLLVAFFREEK
jgi:hypothetical protein